MCLTAPSHYRICFDVRQGISSKTTQGGWTHLENGQAQNLHDGDVPGAILLNQSVEKQMIPKTESGHQAESEDDQIANYKVASRYRGLNMTRFLCL